MRKPMLPALHPAGIALGALLTGLGVILAEILLGPLLSRTISDPQAQILGQVHRRLSESYVRPVSPEWLMQRAVEGMIDSFEDPYTFFIPPEQMTALEEESSGQLVGIGVLLDGESAQVRWPVPGGPAERAGIRPGDRLVAIDGESVDGFTLEQVVAELKGPEGTPVHLALDTLSGRRLECDVVRAPVPTGTVVWPSIVDEEHGIATVAIRSFADSTEDELDRALEDLEEQGMQALVLDLRFNQGGLLRAAVNSAARFLEGGAVCTLRDRKEVRVMPADLALSRAPDLPLVVLINKRSASGSEVMAGALRDHGAAVLLGERSFGKGVFQQQHRYEGSNFAFKFTAGYYLTPTGRVLESLLLPDSAGGLEPDIPVAVPKQVSDRIRLYLSIPEPPEKYRDTVFRLFENVARLRRPDDPALDAAVDLLRTALTGA